MISKQRSTIRLKCQNRMSKLALRVLTCALVLILLNQSFPSKRKNDKLVIVGGFNVHNEDWLRSKSGTGEVRTKPDDS